VTDDVRGAERGAAFDLRSTRAGFLKKSGVAVAAASTVPLWAKPTGAYARLTKVPIKVGLFGPVTGVQALNGIDLRRGFEMWAAEKKNTLLGRPLQITFEDETASPATALQKVRKLVEQDKVHVLVGGINAALGAPMLGYVNQVGMPWLLTLASDNLTQRDAPDNQYAIRIGDPASKTGFVMADWIRRKRPSIKNVAFVGTDFVFGYELISGFQDVWQRKGGHTVQKIWIPLGAPDFTPFLSRVDRNADAVFAHFSGADSVRFLQQYAQVGLRDQVPLFGSFTLTDESVLLAQGMTDKAVVGVIGASRYSPVLNTKQSKAWVARYIKQYGVVPTATSEVGYDFGLALEGAAKRRNGDFTNRRKLAQAFVGLSFNAPRGPITIDKRRQAVSNVYIRRIDKTQGTPVPGYDLPYQNTVIDAQTKVSQFWQFQPEGFQARPRYTRDYPPIR
jgi:branched-chain amino acid transport system substrate-binding protein